MRLLVLISSLNVSAILPATPVQSSGSRAEKSPRLKTINAESNCLVSSSLPLVVERFRDRGFVVRGAFFIGWGHLEKWNFSRRRESDARYQTVHMPEP